MSNHQKHSISQCLVDRIPRVRLCIGQENFHHISHFSVNNCELGFNPIFADAPSDAGGLFTSLVFLAYNAL